MITTEAARGMLIGLAVGDALGAPVEFARQGDFEPVTDMRSGGPFALPAGYWTDDTSMALCLADSVLECGGYDSADLMDRWVRWRTEGYRSSTGVCFDIGNQTSRALSAWQADPTRAPGPWSASAGNGCVMRLAPVVIAATAAGLPLEVVADVAGLSAIETHYSVEAREATAVLARVLCAAASGAPKDALLPDLPAGSVGAGVVGAMVEAASAGPEQLDPSGYVLDTLRVAWWAFATTDTFADGALAVVNRGGDADTIAAVYGQIAGAFHGFEAIPARWREQLHACSELVEVADRLAAVERLPVRARFPREDWTTGQA